MSGDIRSIKGGNGRLRILLVEDTDQHARLITRMIEQTQLKTSLTRCKTLGEALNEQKVSEFDLTLLDLSLPDSTLSETLSRFRKSTSVDPVIVLTSLKDIDFASKSVQDGAQDFLVKTELSASVLERSIRYAMERHRTLQELTIANSNLSKFADFLCHELRGPLNTITMLNSIFQRVASDDSALGGSVLALQRATHELTETIDEVYSLGTNRSAKIELVDLDEVAREAWNRVREQTQEAEAVMDFVSELPSVLADRIALKHVFQNLFSNSLKYRSEKPLRLSVESKSDGSSHRITVRDNGLGIPEDQRETVFQIFHRLERDRDCAGSGIGMALCKQAIARSGGRIWVEPSDSGCAVAFELPAAERKLSSAS